MGYIIFHQVEIIRHSVVTHGFTHHINGACGRDVGGEHTEGRVMQCCSTEPLETEMQPMVLMQYDGVQWAQLKPGTRQ